jgi:hypothetical protein
MASSIGVMDCTIVDAMVVLTELLENYINDLESILEIVGSCASFLTLREDTVYSVH